MYHLCRESHSETIMLALATTSEIREPISMMVKDFSELSTKRNVTHGSHKVCKLILKVLHHVTNQLNHISSSIYL